MSKILFLYIIYFNRISDILQVLHYFVIEFDEIVDNWTENIITSRKSYNLELGYIGLHCIQLLKGNTV